MLKVIFFDGDGTLWYPETTKRTRKPHWVYSDPTIADPIKEFVATPGAIETLEELGRRGIKRVLLSTTPLPIEEGIMHRIAILKHVDLHHLLDDVRVAPARVTGKGECIVELLKEYDIAPHEALMVGDTFLWDIEAAAQVGVQGLLIDSEYSQATPEQLQTTKVIRDLRGVLYSDYLTSE